MSVNAIESAPSMPTRRTVLGAALAGAAAWLGASTFAPSALAGTADPIVEWIDRRAHRLRGIDPDLPEGDLAPLRRIVGSARIVGLGEASHSTHELFVLKQRIARYLVERLGFRTIAWEEAWASGVLIDRYVTRGDGDPVQIARQTTYNLNYQVLVELMEWMRAFNEGRPHFDQVRFVGADVVQLRELQFVELERYVADVAPERAAALSRHLDPLKMQMPPGHHTGWYRGLTPDKQRPFVADARAVDRIVRDLPHGVSCIDRFEARMHARTLRGFYEAYTPEGDARDIRDRFIAAILERWTRTTVRPILYSAANAHTAALPHQTVSMPIPHLDPEDWVTERSLAGGLLRKRHGDAYVSIGTSFDHGAMLSGWATGEVQRYDIPSPDPVFIDHVLGQARYGDFLLDLRHPAPKPAAVRHWLGARGRMRIYSGAYYDPTDDPSYYIAANRWGAGFDALLHLNEVSPARLL